MHTIEQISVVHVCGLGNTKCNWGTYFHELKCTKFEMLIKLHLGLSFCTFFCVLGGSV
jgi:hypothetical protein